MDNSLRSKIRGRGIVMGTWSWFKVLRRRDQVIVTILFLLFAYFVPFIPGVVPAGVGGPLLSVASISYLLTGHGATLSQFGYHLGSIPGDF